ncbi:MAG TPA: hypothetical protein VM120_21115 [Bryobacteraceae bacterium]|nr:hypothetical protein [Bryobacteraceae bacterium]
MEPVTNSRLSKSTNFVLGEKWGGLGSFQVYLKENGVRSTPSNSLTAIVMQWRKSFEVNAPVEFQISNGSGITIDSGSLWQVTIPEQVLTPPAAGKYVWAIRFTWNATPHTLIYGETTVHNPFNV